MKHSDQLSLLGWGQGCGIHVFKMIVFTSGLGEFNMSFNMSFFMSFFGQDAGRWD